MLGNTHRLSCICVLQKFKEFVNGSNLITKLQAKHDLLKQTLGEGKNVRGKRPRGICVPQGFYEPKGFISRCHGLEKTSLYWHRVGAVQSRGLLALGHEGEA